MKILKAVDISKFIRLPVVYTARAGWETVQLPNVLILEGCVKKAV
jgi:hypothetical protein